MHKVALEYDQLVYIGVGNRLVHYRTGRSKILYIGTTKRGIRRIAGSAATRASEMFAVHGVRTVHFYVYSVRGRQRVNMARKLERALLLTFKDLYGEPPLCNTHGRRMHWIDEEHYFRKSGLKGIIKRHD